MTAVGIKATHLGKERKETAKNFKTFIKAMKTKKNHGRKKVSSSRPKN